jgi:two-component system NtrC family sensor kinase
MARDPRKRRPPKGVKKRAPRRRTTKRATKAAVKSASRKAKKASARRPARRDAGKSVAKVELARLSRELKEVQARQAATAEVLQVISSSAGDLKPVFEAMLGKAMHLCEAQCGFIYQLEMGAMRAMAEIGVPPAFAEYRRNHLHTGGAGTPADVMRVTRKPAHVHDARDSEPYRQGNPNAVAGVDLGGARTVLFVPMIKDDDLVGVINLYRMEVKPFSDAQIALLESFASQAVIAIENARLFNETKEALERQTATADILKVIASSPSDVQPVFEAIASSANRLLGGHSTAVLRVIEGMTHLAAFTPVNPAADAALKSTFPIQVNAMPFFGRVAGGEPYLEADIETIPVEQPRQMARARGYRSFLFVPLMNAGQAIGVISVTRAAPGTFAPHQVQLLQAFADQAVIAIENTRLFNETNEALARQTATSDVLKVIASSPSNLQPVFDAIAERSKALIGAHSTIVVRLVDGVMELAGFTPVNPQADAVLQSLFPRLPEDSDPQIAQILRGEIAEITDAEADHRTSTIRDAARARGWRSQLLVPLKDDGGVIGWISITRKEVGSFAAKDVELLRTFADQAVIAISNVELFQAVQDRTRELSRSLDELRAAQDRLVQTEKLASLGQLTAGIAHEIKNPLNFINNFSALSGELIDELDTALAPVALDEKTRGDVGELTALLKSNLEKVVQHGKRADSIVKNMLLHSREGSGERRSADINALVEESLNLAYHGARAERSDFEITLARDLDPGAGQVELYPQEITRALLNMISNGFYAATRRANEAGNGFEPTLRAATRGLADRVEIRIRDNGTGIPPEVKDRMFNPFFTTKPPGEGTGLGLSMTHDIVVKQHGGTIDVATEPGRFTEFVIVLPRTK